MKETIRKNIHDNFAVLTATFDGEMIATLESIVTCVVAAMEDGKKLLLCGNGGSAADCQHVAAEFVGRFKKERKSYPAIALTTDTSILTAVANDYSFEDIFSRQIEGLGQEGDVLFAISTSGNSANIVKAARTAKACGITVVGFTGSKKNVLAQEADIIVAIGSEYTPYIQAGHIMALHIICEFAESLLCSSS